MDSNKFQETVVNLLIQIRDSLNDVLIDEPEPEPPSLPPSNREMMRMDERTKEIMDLAMEMGEQFIMGPNGQLVVDNRVLDTYARRHGSDAPDMT